ncbi:MAG: aminoacyl-tRNA hydrolase [Rhodothermales bacterium]|nr:aminoacyl-tRNA hydrolase [Rhodothermales bacterium]MBO6780920.1 aminoacyl-tRNA hydrolase [Rhodothermales bacterium]
MAKRLLVGLGNPGEEYAETRHNVGFRVIDALAERTRTKVTRRRDEMLFGWGKWRGRELGLAMPQTYMNRSGTALEVFVRKWKVEPSELLVIVDDIHLPLGKLRMRPKGGSGGHNGIQDIIDWLDTQEFPRLRIGVGKEFDEGSQSDYVLSPFDAEEKDLLDDVLTQSMNAALTFVTDGINVAMNRFNN